MNSEAQRLVRETGVTILHDAVRGRVRLRIAPLRRAAHVKDRLEAALGAHDDIERASANPTTGTLLVVFDPALSTAHILERVAACLSGHPQPANDPLPAARPAAGPDSEPWHVIETDAILARLNGRRGGLTPAEARASLARHGRNHVPPPERRSALAIAAAQFESLPVAMLGAAAGLSLLTGGLLDAAVILSVVAINAAIGYATESRAERTIESLADLVRPPARVMRDGIVTLVPNDEVAVGDVLDLAPGGIVAADARVIEAHGLSVNEAMLTGESLPAAKSATALDRLDVPLGDRADMVYKGTVVTGGSGFAAVVANGRRTEMARIQALVGETRPPQAPMQVQLDRLGNQLVWASAAICAGLFGIGLLRGYGLLTMLKSAVSLAVAALPEGLPTVATTTLALGVRAMHRRDVLVRHVAAVETLGSVDVICFDKTGTLTFNRMAAVAAWVGGRRLGIVDGAFACGGAPVAAAADPDLRQLLTVAALCNEAEADPDNSSGGGSATEAALVAMARDGGIEVARLRARHPVHRLVRRTEGRRHMRTVHRRADGSRYHAVKGSPAEVLAMCGSYLHDGTERPLDDAVRERALEENHRMARGALRVLGFACRAAEPGDGDRPLVWLGLVGLADPVRPGMAGLMADFHGAGIDTAMITGDQSTTAFAIADRLSLARHGQLEILEAGDLDSMGTEMLGPLAAKTQVFARVSPAQKLRIVQALQHEGRVVAMTGDGVNDSPALKAADIGIAMGHGGTDVAREAADVVLASDDLRTMTVAVANGRTIYTNVRKAIRYLLTTNMSEIELMLVANVIGLGQPLAPMQLLWINLVTDIFPGLALAMDPPDPDVLRQPPRDPREPIMPRGALGRMAGESAVLAAGAFAAYGWGVARYGVGARANGLAFASLTAAQLLYALSCRDPGHSRLRRRGRRPNRWLALALIGSFAAQALLFLVPGLRRLFGLSPLGLLDLAVAAAGGLAPVLAVEAAKAVAPPRPTTANGGSDDDEP